MAKFADATVTEKATALTVQTRNGDLSPARAVIDFHKSGCNMVLAADSLGVGNPNYSVDFQVVTISPDKDKKMVHSIGQKYMSQVDYEASTGLAWTKQKQKDYVDWDMSLSASSYALLAQAAGVIWVPSETRPTQVTKDFVLFQAVGLMRNSGGEQIVISGTKEIWLDAIEEEIQKEQTIKTYNKDVLNIKGPWVQGWVREFDYSDLDPELQKRVDLRTKGEFLQYKKNRMARAETGAKNRAIKSGMGLKPTYTVAELTKPFVVARIIPIGSHSESYAAASEAVFGPRYKPAPIEALHVAPLPNTQVRQLSDGSVVDAATGEILNTQPEYTETSPQPGVPGPTDSDAPEDVGPTNPVIILKGMLGSFRIPHNDFWAWAENEFEIDGRDFEKIPDFQKCEDWIKARRPPVEEEPDRSQPENDDV